MAERQKELVIKMLHMARLNDWNQHGCVTNGQFATAGILRYGAITNKLEHGEKYRIRTIPPKELGMGQGTFGYKLIHDPRCLCAGDGPIWCPIKYAHHTGGAE